jgi:hypothetical protein
VSRDNPTLHFEYLHTLFHLRSGGSLEHDALVCVGGEGGGGGEGQGQGEGEVRGGDTVTQEGTGVGVWGGGGGGGGFLYRCPGGLKRSMWGI